MASALAVIQQAEKHDQDTANFNLYALAQSRDAWVTDLLGLANRLLQSPSRTETIDLKPDDFRCCKDAGNAQFAWWSVSTKDEKFGQFIYQPLTNVARKSHHAQFRFYSKAKNKIRNISADTFASRTSSPHYFSEPHAYPPQSSNERSVCSKINEAEHKFVPPYATRQLEIGDNYKHVSSYLNKSSLIRLLSLSHVIEAQEFLAPGSVSKNMEDPHDLFKHVWPGRWMNMLWAGSPPLRPDLGREMHALGETEAAAQLVTATLYGVRYGALGWRRFSTIVCQGGWPWLNSYNKAFAKAVYIVLVSLFAALEQGKVTAGTATGTLMLELAKLLVGHEGGTGTGLRLRMQDRLKCPKTKVYGIKAPNPDRELATMTEGAPENEQVMQLQNPSKSTLSVRLKSKNSQRSFTAVQGVASSENEKYAEGPGSSSAPIADHKGTEVTGWTLSDIESPRPPLKAARPSYIIVTEKCNHGENLPFSGRVKRAHSLKELEQQLEGDSSMTVAQTLGEEQARDEVANYVIEGRILTVQRTEGQCIYCAYRIAHCVGALVVIG